MPVLKRIIVQGAAHKMIDTPKYDAHLSRYTATVERGDGSTSKVYSRFPDGPFVFTIPAPENNQ